MYNYLLFNMIFFNFRKLSVQSRNRPFSAMDAYRYILDHPRKSLGGSDVFNTSYQQQRTEAWRQSASTSASNPQTRNIACSSISDRFLIFWIRGAKLLYHSLTYDQRPLNVLKSGLYVWLVII